MLKQPFPIGLSNRLTDNDQTTHQKKTKNQEKKEIKQNNMYRWYGITKYLSYAYMSNNWCDDNGPILH